MNKEFSAIVFVMRGQPLHNAHYQTIKLALEKADKVVVVLGSAFEPRTYFKNPFTVEERTEILRDAFPDEYRLYITCVENNVASDELWADAVYNAVGDEIGDMMDFQRIGKIGFKKDKQVERVLDLFPNWEYIETPVFEPLDATSIREVFFNPMMNLKFLIGVCPQSTIDFLTKFRKTEDYQQLLCEKKYIEEYKKGFAGLPYAPTFLTGDAVVIQSGYVLLVQRAAEPGKGLLALPGGFMNAQDYRNKEGVLIKADESLVDAAIRELYEETKIDIDEATVRANIVGNKIFDAVDRSARGRTVTMATFINLPGGEWNLPEVTGSDDAAPEGTCWYSINSLKRQDMFEDHLDIIRSHPSLQQ